MRDTALELSAAALLALAATTPAHAADKVKVGFVSTLSGPSAALGIDIERRAETVSVEEFVELARILSSSRA